MRVSGTPSDKWGWLHTIFLRHGEWQQCSMTVEKLECALSATISYVNKYCNSVAHSGCSTERVQWDFRVLTGLLLVLSWIETQKASLHSEVFIPSLNPFLSLLPCGSLFLFQKCQ